MNLHGVTTSTDLNTICGYCGEPLWKCRCNTTAGTAMISVHLLDTTDEGSKK